MRAILIGTILLAGILGCDYNLKTHQIFYGTTPPPVASITVGVVETVKPLSKSGFSSPSMISPNQLATVKMVEILKGEGVGDKIGLAFELGRSNEPVASQRYVFLWDQNGRCVQYFTVQGKFYLNAGRELPLEDLKK